MKANQPGSPASSKPPRATGATGRDRRRLVYASLSVSHGGDAAHHKTKSDQGVDTLIDRLIDILIGWYIYLSTCWSDDIMLYLYMYTLIYIASRSERAADSAERKTTCYYMQKKSIRPVCMWKYIFIHLYIHIFICIDIFTYIFAQMEIQCLY